MPVEQSSSQMTTGRAEGSYSILILDWELCHISSFVFDLGQMVTELYLQLHFRDSQAVPLVIDVFRTAYGPIDKQDAPNVTIYCGVRLMGWPWWVPGWENEMQMERKCVEEGEESRMEKCVG